MPGSDETFLRDVAEGIPGTTLLGRCVKVYQSVSSTNDVAKRLVQTRSASGTVVVAEKQTQGRGRRGASWYSPPDAGLWCSVLLPAEQNLDRLGLYALMAGLSVACAIESLTGTATELKWPNDVVIKGKKVGGILIETTASETACDGLVIGLGINVNQQMFPDHLQTKATSILMATGRRLQRKDLLYEIVQLLEQQYLQLKKCRTRAIIQNWKQRRFGNNQSVWLWLDGVRVQGHFSDLDAFGRMLVLLPDGRQIPITSSAHVEFEELYDASGH